MIAPPLIPLTEVHSSYPEYLWYPSALARAAHSAERLAAEYSNYLSNNPSDPAIHSFITSSIEEGLGIHDYTSDEISNIANNPEQALYHYADMVSRRSQSGWSTHGHSAADVNIYASDQKLAAPLVGNHENTEIGAFLRNYLGVKVDEVTKELKKAGKDLKMLNATHQEVGWMGPIPEEGERLDGQTHLVNDMGDFMKRGVVHGSDCGCGH